MNEVHGETFALAHRGIGRNRPARVLAQRLASFTPQLTRGADPWLSARSGGAITNELDLAALTPQAPEAPEEQGAAMPANSIARDDVAQLGETAVWPDDRQPSVPAQASPPPPTGAIASAPQVHEWLDETIQSILPPQRPAEPKFEVFALALPASVPPAVAAHNWGLAQSPATPQAPAAPALEASESRMPSTAVAPSAAASEPRESLPRIAPRAPAPAPTAQAAAMSPPPARPTASEAHRPSQAQPVPLQSDLGPLHPTPAPIRPAVLPAQPMGQSEAPASPARLPPAAPDQRVLERLAEAARKPSDDAVVRIGSVSVVMRPAAPAPAPQHMAPPAPPPNAATRSVHRNPWLNRGRGGE